jgi:hypothetical protein
MIASQIIFCARQIINYYFEMKFDSRVKEAKRCPRKFFGTSWRQNGAQNRGLAQNRLATKWLPNVGRTTSLKSVGDRLRANRLIANFFYIFS